MQSASHGFRAQPGLLPRRLREEVVPGVCIGMLSLVAQWVGGLSWQLN